MPQIKRIRSDERLDDASYKIVVQNAGGPYSLDEHKGRVFEVGLDEAGQRAIDRAAAHASDRGIAIIHVVDDVPSQRLGPNVKE